MKKSLVLLLAAFIVGAVACGGDDSPAVTTLTCNRDLSDLCWSATGPEPDLASAGYSRTTCEQGGEGVLVSACSPEGRVGRCTESKGSVRVVTHLYAPTWAASFQTACLVYGTWEPN